MIRERDFSFLIFFNTSSLTSFVINLQVEEFMVHQLSTSFLLNDLLYSFPFLFLTCLNVYNGVTKYISVLFMYKGVTIEDNKLFEMLNITCLVLFILFTREIYIHYHGVHRDWKMKIAMEKSWNMKNWPKVMESCECLCITNDNGIICMLQ